MAGSINKVILIGNVGAEMKVHQFDDGGKIGRLPLATSESYTSRQTGERIEQTEWHNLVVRNRVVDIFEQYVKKGDKLYIEGKIKTRKWKNEQGMDRYMTEIIVENFTFLTPKGASGMESESMTTPSQKVESQTSSAEVTPSSETENEMEEEDDDLPF